MSFESWQTCCGLPYASQQETPFDPDLRKSCKLGDDGGLGEPVLWKPGGVHWRTFKGLRNQIDAREQVAEAYFIKAAQRLFGAHQ